MASASSQTGALAAIVVENGAAPLVQMAKKGVPIALRGIPASSRTWKSVQTRRTSASGRPKANNMRNSGISFKAAMAVKKARTAVKDTLSTLRGEREAEVTAQREKRVEKARRRAAGEMKSAQVQQIDPAKMKKMNKKQLRHIRKTRVNAQTGAVELVGAYQ